MNKVEDTVYEIVKELNMPTMPSPCTAEAPEKRNRYSKPSQSENSKVTTPTEPSPPVTGIQKAAHIAKYNMQRQVSAPAKMMEDDAHPPQLLVSSLTILPEEPAPI